MEHLKIPSFSKDYATKRLKKIYDRKSPLYFILKAMLQNGWMSKVELYKTIECNKWESIFEGLLKEGSIIKENSLYKLVKVI